jgi:hypothetical protein
VAARVTISAGASEKTSTETRPMATT